MDRAASRSLLTLKEDHSDIDDITTRSLILLCFMNGEFRVRPHLQFTSNHSNSLRYKTPSESDGVDVHLRR